MFGVLAGSPMATSHTYSCICMDMYRYTCIYLHHCVYICMYMYSRFYLHTNTHTHTYTHTRICNQIYIYIRVYIYICCNLCIYIYINIVNYKTDVSWRHLGVFMTACHRTTSRCAAGILAAFEVGVRSWRPHQTVTINGN